MDCDKELKIGFNCDFNDCFHVEIFIDNSKTLFTTDYFFKELCAKFQKIECLVTFINGQQTNKSKTQINESFQILLNTSLMISPTSINVNTNEIYNFLVQIHSKMCAHVKSDLQIKKICINKIQNIFETIRLLTMHESDICFTEKFSNIHLFHSQYHMEQWARSKINVPFDNNDPFLVSPLHEKSRAFLRSYLHHKQAVFSKNFKFKQCNIGPFDDWRDNVITWWNDWIENGWFYRKPQLFLHGNCKQVNLFIEQVLFGNADKNNKLPLETILQPQGRSPRYFLSHANKEKNKVIYVKKFDITQYEINNLKLLVQGDQYGFCQKRLPNKFFSLQIPAIFVSKRNIPKCVGETSTESFKDRFLIVHVPTNNVCQH